MATYLITHEVEDVDHWCTSTKRAEVFGPLGVELRTFRDLDGSNTVGIIAEIPDMDAYEEFMQTETAAKAIEHDGVRMDTLRVFAATQA